ncbi:adenosylcobinamide-GDP ribazoletransferase [Endozoicomonas ascidiicola]|uniref:adenosylcobinamide-GDP ribazoletransferase n=1 Tax=Endozoicomonas ascidiicola TaxID=1698521 RepID=UPI00082ECAB8|nr:adenosylcobinamide-GDP ribazoletransferase [Endozoicomonas ascidiicola]
MAAVIYQYHLFMLALGFFSRIPVPASIPYSEQRMNQAGRYFALVGLLLGFLCAVVFWLASLVLPTTIAVFLMISFSLMLTGAFHEDGLTDMADGIGGGMTVERRLDIMKDSRIGTYGAAALIMALLGKFLMLVELADSNQLAIAIIVAYMLSRAVAASLIYDTPYVSDTDTSKSKPLAQKQSSTELLILAVTGVLPCFLFGIETAMTIIAITLIFRSLFKRWIIKRIGGFTGDCLGAAQQLSELLIYLILIATMP